MGSDVKNNLDPGRATMVVFPDTMYTYIGIPREVQNRQLFLISNFCNSIQLIQILHALIHSGGGGGGARDPDPLKKHKLYGFL